MDVLSPTLSENRGRTSEPSTLRVTLDRRNRDKDQSSSSIFPGFAGLLSILLVIVVLCVLWKWNKRKKWRIPYLGVPIMPLLTLPRSRQQTKNIYDPLPQRQEELGRHQSRSLHVFSIESLLSRHSDSPPSVRMPSQAGNALQLHRAQTQIVDIYDNATRPPTCGNLTPSAYYVNVRATREYPSISSEDSRDYANVPTAEETAETLASTNLCVFPSDPELEFTEERDQGCGNANNFTSFWSPGTESSDPLNDEDGSSQSSNDYVNLAGLDLAAIQGKQPWMSFQYCRNYENVPPADPDGSL